MAKMIQVPYDYSISVPVATAQAVQENNENPISLEALGLLVNLLSYPTKWELHKTEVYKRFAKNKRTSVKTAWNDLVGANYMIEFRYRSGRSYEYVYYYRKVPFSPEEKAEILANAEKEFGEIWDVDFVQPKLDTPKSTPNQKNILNKKPILNNNNKDIENIDDDMRTSPSGEDSTLHSDEDINLIISNLREATKEDMVDRSFNSVVRKVVDKYNQGKVNSFRDYLVTALVRKIEELELRRIKDKAKHDLVIAKKQKAAEKLQNRKINKNVVFYNWLEK